MLKIKHTGQLTKEKSDTLIIPHVVSRKGIAAWRVIGRLKRSENTTKRRRVLRNVFWLNYNPFPERFPQNEINLESQLAIVVNEDTCSHSDHIAHEDNSYIATWNERQRYEKNGKFSMNAQGQNAPMTERGDNSEVDKATKDLRPKDEQECNYPILQSHQTRQRPFEKGMEIEFLVHIIFVFICMDRVANLAYTSIVEGCQCIFLQEVSLRGNSDPFL